MFTEGKPLITGIKPSHFYFVGLGCRLKHLGSKMSRVKPRTQDLTRDLSLTAWPIAENILSYNCVGATAPVLACPRLPHKANYLAETGDSFSF